MRALLSPAMRAAVVVLAVLAGSTARGQAAASGSRGLDVIILVDVSSSMSRSAQGRGSDPDRIRWDAVQLAADLLTVEDRLLVQRFNHECPPPYTEDGKRLAYFTTEQGKPTQPLRPEDDFPPHFVQLAGAQRERLEGIISRFNTVADWEGSLDRGDTAIINALQVVAALAGQPTPGRQPHVILLTDGLDNHHQKYRAESELRKALHAYTGEAERTPIPIHTIGLGLAALDPQAAIEPRGNPGQPAEPSCEAGGSGHATANPSGGEGQQAEEFLLRISSLTGGNYYHAATNRDLIRIFLSLVRDLKGAWFQHHRLAAGARPGIPATAMGGIVDLGVLAFEIDPQATGAKTTRPLSQPLQLDWVGLNGNAAPAGKHHTGKGGSVYDYHYFGKTSQAETEKSPFAKFPASARLALTAPPAERAREVVLIKSTQEPLFSMVQPAEGARFFRNQALAVEVAMLPSSFFGLEHFEVTARLLCAGQAASEDEAQSLGEVTLTPDKAKRRFTGVLSPGRLRPSQAEVDYYTLSVTVHGKRQGENSLAEFRLDLPPRTVAVANVLQLREVAPVELTEKEPLRVIDIATAYPVPDNLTLQAQFVPFRRDGQPIDLKDLVFVTRQGDIARQGLLLQQGQAQVAIGYPPRPGVELPQGGVVYQEGKIVITSREHVRIEPNEIKVRLRLALAKVAVEPGLLAVDAAAKPTASPAAKVQLAASNQPKTEVGELQAEIRQSEAADNAGVEFPVEELWIQPAGAEPLPAGQRSQSLALTLGQSFQVWLHPQQPHEPGKRQFEVVLSGPGADETRVPLTVLVQAPALEAQVAEQVVYATPGAVATGEFPIRVSGPIAEAFEASVRGADGAAMFEFRNVDPLAETQSLSLRVETATESNSVKVLPPSGDGPAPWASLPFRVFVPPETPPEPYPFGRYRAQLTVTSPQTSDVTLAVELVVNSLFVEFPVAAERGQPPTWRPLPESPLPQLLGRGMTQSFRIRMGSGEPLSPEQIQIVPLRPFADETGDTMRLPEVASQTSADRGRSVVAVLRFPETPNAHVHLPYQVQVEVRAPEHHVPPVLATFRVHYLDPRDFFEPVE